MGKILNKNFFYFLLILYPLTYPLGVFITETLTMFFIFFFIFVNRDKSYLKDNKIIFLLFVSVYLGVNALIQIDDNLKFSSIFYFRYILFSISIFFCFEFFKNINDKKKNIIISLFIIIIFIIILDALFQFFNGKNLLGFELKKDRVSGIFNSELILGSYLIKMLPLVLWCLFYRNFNFDENKKKLILFFSTYFLCIFLSGERTSFALALLFIFSIAFLVKPLKKIFISSICNFLVILVLISIFNFGKTDPVNRMFIKTFNQITNYYFLKENNHNTEITKNVTKNSITKENILIFSKDHHGHYQLAFELFKNNLIFGVGPKGFRYYCRSVNYDPPIGICSTHPHNFLIQIAAETGLLGLALFGFALFFLISSLINSYKIKANDNDRFLLITITIGFLVNLFPFFPSGNFFNNWISIINYYFLGIYFYSYKKIFIR